MRLLLDEMFGGRLAALLRERGFDVVAVVDDPALRGGSDLEVFVEAQKEVRTLVTRDLGGYRRFAARLLEQRASHPGLILVTDPAFPEASPRTIGRLVMSLLALLEEDTDIEGREYWLR